jgi:excisionase family DNA binding protein
VIGSAEAGCAASCDHLLTISEVAQFVAVSRDVVEKLISRGELVAIDISPRIRAMRHRPIWRVKPKDLEAFLERRTARPVTAARLRRRSSDEVFEFVR